MGSEPLSNNPQLVLPVSKPMLNRRLVIIPLLFVLVILLVMGYSQQSLSAYQTKAAALELIIKQRALRTEYVNQVLLARQGIDTPYQGTMRELEEILNVLLEGGRIVTETRQEPVRIVPVDDPEVRAELQRKRVLGDALEFEAERLLRMEQADSPEAQASIRRISEILTALETPGQNLVPMYLEEADARINRTIALGLLLVMLLGVLGVLLTLQQRKADRILIRNEEWFRQVFDSSPIGKVLIDSQGRWFKVNPAACALLGYSEPELNGKTFEEMTFVEDYEQEKPLRNRLFQGAIKQYQMTKRYVHKDGHVIWTMASVAAVYGEQAQPQYAIAQLVDISEQRQAMEALQASEARYRNVVEWATDSILISDSHGQILSANPQAYRTFGYLADELAGQALADLVPERYRHLFANGVQGAGETGIPRLAGQTLEIAGLRKDGTEFPIEVSLSFWQNPQGETFCTGIARDISERKQTELELRELAESNKNLEEFALIASHDMQEPLRKISVYSERLAMRDKAHLSEEGHLYLSKIQDSTRRMQTLINDLLSYSRVSLRGREFASIPLNRVVEEVLADLEPMIQESGAVIDVETLPAVEADRTQMRQLFANLVENALKYRRSGVSPHIHIYGKVLDETSRDGIQMARIRVEDNGIGFDEKYLDRIFKVFQRLHGREQYSGTGIGLATCRRIMERHHGNITATSTPGSGSTFIITLPVRQSVTQERVGTPVS